MHFSLVQTVSPNPILCISGWNLIWITDFPHSVSQLFISDLCVHRCSFIFTECELVSIVMPLRCYAYAKSNSNVVCNSDVVLRHDNMLPSQLRCIIIFHLMRQRQKCKKLECAALFCAAVSATSTWLALRNATSLYLQRCSACFLQKCLTCLPFYVAWGCEELR